MTMKRFALLATAALLAGCADSATDTVSTSGDADATAALVAPETDVDRSPVAVSFESGDTASLAIPEMHCPFGCFPTAKDALEGVDGVASVELVEQEKEGEINDRRVVVTFDGPVDGAAAIAALEAAELPGSSFEEAVSSNN